MCQHHSGTAISYDCVRHTSASRNGPLFRLRAVVQASDPELLHAFAPHHAWVRELESATKEKYHLSQAPK